MLRVVRSNGWKTVTKDSRDHGLGINVQHDLPTVVRQNKLVGFNQTKKSDLQWRDPSLLEEQHACR